MNQELRDWQRGPGRIDYRGQRLKPDGDMGPATLWAQHLETLAPWRVSACRAVLTLNGMAELPGNHGTVPEFVAQLTGAPEGSPWCAALYSWALWVAGVLDWAQDFRPEASVARLRDLLTPVPAGQAQPGDFASLLHPDGTGHGGTLIWPGDTEVASCDGNVGNQVELIRYPIEARQYFSPQKTPGWAKRLGDPPKSIRLYTSGTTR